MIKGAWRGLLGFVGSLLLPLTMQVVTLLVAGRGIYKSTALRVFWLALLCQSSSRKSSSVTLERYLT